MARTDQRVTAVILRDGKLLMIHRFREGMEYWVFPGGGVEEGEDLQTALRREVKEETGLGLVSFRYLFDQVEHNGNTSIFYLCQVTAGELQLGGPELASQSPSNRHILEWVELGQVSTLKAAYPKGDRLVVFLTNVPKDPMV